MDSTAVSFFIPIVLFSLFRFARKKKKNSVENVRRKKEFADLHRNINLAILDDDSGEIETFQIQLGLYFFISKKKLGNFAFYRVLLGFT